MGSKNAIRIVQSPHNFKFLCVKEWVLFAIDKSQDTIKMFWTRVISNVFLHHFWYTSELRCVIRFFSSPFNPFFFVFFNGFYAFQLEIILIKNLIIESDHFILCCTAIYLDPPLDRVLTNLKLVTFYVTHCFVFNLKIRTV